MIIAPRDLVIVEVVYEKKIGSIEIAETYGGKENTMDYYGIVIAVGEISPFVKTLKAGDKIRFHRNEGIKVKTEDKEFVSLKPRAILCKEV